MPAPAPARAPGGGPAAGDAAPQSISSSAAEPLLEPAPCEAALAFGAAPAASSLDMSSLRRRHTCPKKRRICFNCEHF